MIKAKSSFRKVLSSLSVFVYSCVAFSVTEGADLNSSEIDCGFSWGDYRGSYLFPSPMCASGEHKSLSFTYDPAFMNGPQVIPTSNVPAAIASNGSFEGTVSMLKPDNITCSPNTQGFYTFCASSAFLVQDPSSVVKMDLFCGGILANCTLAMPGAYNLSALNFTQPVDGDLPLYINLDSGFVIKAEATDADFVSAFQLRVSQIEGAKIENMGGIISAWQHNASRGGAVGVLLAQGGKLEITNGDLDKMDCTLPAVINSYAGNNKALSVAIMVSSDAGPLLLNNDKCGIINGDIQAGSHPDSVINLKSGSLLNGDITLGAASQQVNFYTDGFIGAIKTLNGGELSIYNTLNTTSEWAEGLNPLTSITHDTSGTFGVFHNLYADFMEIVQGEVELHAPFSGSIKVGLATLSMFPGFDFAQVTGSGGARLNLYDDYNTTTSFGPYFDAYIYTRNNENERPSTLFIAENMTGNIYLEGGDVFLNAGAKLKGSIRFDHPNSTVYVAGDDAVILGDITQSHDSFGGIDISGNFSNIGKMQASRFVLNDGTLSLDNLLASDEALLKSGSILNVNTNAYNTIKSLTLDPEALLVMNSGPAWLSSEDIFVSSNATILFSKGGTIQSAVTLSRDANILLAISGCIVEGDIRAAGPAEGRIIVDSLITLPEQFAYGSEELPLQEVNLTSHNYFLVQSKNYHVAQTWLGSGSLFRFEGAQYSDLPGNLDGAQEGFGSYYVSLPLPVASPYFTLKGPIGATYAVGSFHVEDTINVEVGYRVRAQNTILGQKSALKIYANEAVHGPIDGKLPNQGEVGLFAGSNLTTTAPIGQVNPLKLISINDRSRFAPYHNTTSDVNILSGGTLDLSLTNGNLTGLVYSNGEGKLSLGNMTTTVRGNGININGATISTKLKGQNFNDTGFINYLGQKKTNITNSQIVVDTSGYLVATNQEYNFLLSNGIEADISGSTVVSKDGLSLWGLFKDAFENVYLKVVP